MHDQLITRKIIDDAKKEGKVTEIEVEVGELSGIDGKKLGETLKTLVDWKVRVSGKKARARCNCGFKGRPKITGRAHGIVFFECPSCGKTPNVLSGGDVILKKVGVGG